MSEKEFIRHYDALSDALFRHCYFRIYDREKAKDLVQEIFTRAWEYIVNGNKIKNIKAFLYKTANNLIIDDIRKKKPSSLDELREEKGYEPSLDPKETIEQKIEVKNIIEMLDKLEPAYRDVFIMRYIDNLKPKEIASLIGESQNVISVRIHRSLEKIRNIANSHEK